MLYKFMMSKNFDPAIYIFPNLDSLIYVSVNLFIVMHFLEPVVVARQHYYVVALGSYSRIREELLLWETPLEPEALAFLVKTWAICLR